jgi:hypothetical protein
MDLDIERDRGWWIQEFKGRAGSLMALILLVGVFVDYSSIMAGAFCSALLCGALYLDINPSKRGYVLARSFRKIEEFVLLTFAFAFASVIPLPYGLLCLSILVFWLLSASPRLVLLNDFDLDLRKSFSPLLNLRFITVLLNTALELLLFLILLNLYRSDFLIYDIYLKVAIFPLIAIQSYLTPRLALGSFQLKIGSAGISLFLGIAGLIVFNYLFSNLAVEYSDYRPIPLTPAFFLISMSWIIYFWLSLKFFERFSQRGRVLALASVAKVVTCVVVYLFSEHLSVADVMFIIPALQMIWFLILLGITDDTYFRFRLG